MSLAPLLDQSPEAHALELQCLRTFTGRTVDQVRAIAEGYTEALDPSLVMTPPYQELRFELKSARERFSIFDCPELDRAIAALGDRSGW
jgi:hypothetical protein